MSDFSADFYNDGSTSNNPLSYRDADHLSQFPGIQGTGIVEQVLEVIGAGSLPETAKVAVTAGYAFQRKTEATVDLFGEDRSPSYSHDSDDIVVQVTVLVPSYAPQHAVLADLGRQVHAVEAKARLVKATQVLSDAEEALRKAQEDLRKAEEKDSSFS